MKRRFRTPPLCRPHFRLRLRATAWQAALRIEMIPVDRLAAFVHTVLRQTGLNEEDARVTTEVLITTDTWGVFTHGTKNLRGYVRRLRGGGLRARGRPRVMSEGPAWALVDADSTVGMVGSTFAMKTALAKARTAGIGYVGVRNSCHFGAAGYYAALAAAENFIGVAMANDIPSVSVPGSRGAVLGSNPIAFGVPTGGPHPILLDMATSAVAGGKVYAAAALGKSIPLGWIIDAEGLPSTDPTLLPEAASLLPMAGHKGYGIALLIETLSGILTGASIASHVLSWSFDDPSRATDHGAAFLAIHVEAMMPRSTFAARVQQTIEEIRSAPKAKGADRIYLPGEMEWEKRERALREGLALPEDVLEKLRQLAKEEQVEVNGLFG
ncbi:MAG TPA: Ldh family oxidoreductase [Verrucomicrobiae bacterium]|nr:Ldh family oxidoreductase [Verrucomicrobiae bacterium]